MKSGSKEWSVPEGVKEFPTSLSALLPLACSLNSPLMVMSLDPKLFSRISAPSASDSKLLGCVLDPSAGNTVNVVPTASLPEEAMYSSPIIWPPSCAAGSALLDKQIYKSKRLQAKNSTLFFLLTTTMPLMF